MVLRPTTLKSHMRGSAIVLALGITSLAVIIAATMMIALRMDMRRVEKLEAMTTRNSLVIASEAMAMRMLQADNEEPFTFQPFKFEEAGIKITGEVKALESHEFPSDVKLASNDELILLHTRLKSKKIIDVYSFFKHSDEGWSLLYRSQGVH